MVKAYSALFTKNLYLEPECTDDWDPEFMARECYITETPKSFDQNQSRIVIASLMARIQSAWKDMARVDLLEREVLLLKQELRKLAERMPSVIAINALTDEEYEILHPIVATLERVDNNFTLSLDEVDISASGETPAEAIDAFKEMLVTTTDILESTPDESLSLRLACNKKALRQLIRRRG